MLPGSAVDHGPLVSAILGVRDGARYLAEALQSIVDQHYRPVEILVVDDGSVDDSAEIVRTFPGPVIGVSIGASQ